MVFSHPQCVGSQWVGDCSNISKFQEKYWNCLDFSFRLLLLKIADELWKTRTLCLCHFPWLILSILGTTGVGYILSPITKYTFTNTKYIIPGAFIIISIIAAGLYLKATVFRGKPCRTNFFPVLFIFLGNVSKYNQPRQFAHVTLWQIRCTRDRLKKGVEGSAVVLDCTGWPSSQRLPPSSLTTQLGNLVEEDFVEPRQLFLSHFKMS